MSHWFASVKSMLFPYRTHLEEEVVFLRSLVAQRDRRITEMQDAINAVALKPREPFERSVPKFVETPPKGIEAVRAYNRRQREREMEVQPSGTE